MVSPPMTGETACQYSDAVYELQEGGLRLWNGSIRR